MDRHPDPVQLAEATARIHDLALARAATLRQQAMDAWASEYGGELMSELGRALDHAADHAGRSARRWGQRLARLRLLRTREHGYLPTADEG